MHPPPPPFDPIAGRDAAAAFRGIGFQIDQTTLAWLDLEGSAELYLECGEDLDLVLPASGQRDLRQFTDQAEPLTLRSEKVATFLANVVVHRMRNPGVDLSASLVTTASPTRERPSVLPPGTTGIALWTRLQGASLTGMERVEAVAGLRGLLTTLHAPAGASDDVRERFENLLRVVASEDGLVDLVARVRFHMDSRGGPDLRETITRRLLACGAAPDLGTAGAQYEAMFVAVYRRLADPARTPLTVAERVALLAEPRALATAFASVRSELHRAVKRLYRRVDEIDERLRIIEEAFGDVVQADAIRSPARPLPPTSPPGPFDRVSGATIDGTPPSPLPREAARRSAEALLREAVEACTIVWLVGSSGCGKTVLARRALDGVSTGSFWVKMRDLEPLAAAQQLRAALDANAPSGVTARDRAAAIPRGLVLVLDDLPPLDGADLLSDLLVDVAAGCAAGGSHCLLVTPLGPPGRLLERVSCVHAVRNAPLLTDEDATGLLRVHGAPEQWVARASELNALGAGSPEVLAACARDLALDHWSDRPLSTLPRGAHGAALVDQVLDRVRRTVREEGGRELLFRLSALDGWFEAGLVDVVAALPEAVPHARVVLTGLDGLWIQRSGPLRSVAPVLRANEDDLVPPDQRRATHGALAEHLLREQPLGTASALRVVRHLHRAGDADAAANLLCTALMSLRLQQAWAAAPSVLATWDSVPMDVSPKVAVLVRAHQVTAALAAGFPTGARLTDLRARLDRLAGQDDVLRCQTIEFVVGVAWNIAPRVAAELLSADAARVGTPAWSGAWDPDFAVSMLLGMGVFSTVDDLVQWLDLLGRLDRGVAARLTRHELYAHSAVVVGETIWLGAGFDAPRALALADAVERAGATTGLDMLRVAACRARLAVFTETMHDADRAVAHGRETLGTLRTATATFLVEEAVGRQLAYGGRYDEAWAWFTPAFARETEPPIDGIRLQAMLVAGAAAALTGRGDAASVQEATVAFARRPGRSALDLVRALGEAALGAWQRGDRRGLLDRLIEAFDLLAGVADMDRDPVWLDLVVATGQTATTSLTQVRRPAPPQGSPLPLPGSFLPRTDLRSPPGWPVDASMMLAILASALSHVAGELGAFDAHARLSDRAVTLVAADAHQRRFFGLQTIPQRLIERKWGEAFQCAWEATEELAATTASTGGPASLHTEERRELANRWALGSFLVPAVARLATRHGEGANVQADLVAVLDLCARVGSPRWDDAADAIRAEFDRSDRRSVLTDLLSRSRATDDYHLTLLALLLLAVHPRTALPEALAHHVSVQSNAERFRKAHGVVVDRIFHPVTVADWHRRLQQQAFRFQRPGVLARRFADARSAPPHREMRLVIAAVIEDLGLQPDPSVRAWLDAGP